MIDIAYKACIRQQMSFLLQERTSVILYIFLLLFSVQVYYGNAGTAKLNVFILKMAYSGNSSQVVTYKCAQDSVSCTMQNTYPAYSQKNSIVNEVSYSLYGFVSSHASDVNILFKLEFFLIYIILRLSAYKR